MEQIYAWVSLLAIFLIPLASLVPRMLRKRMKNKEKNTVSKTVVQEKRRVWENTKEHSSESKINSSEFQLKNKLVLGELVKGSKTFENIQKNTGLDSKELDSILEDLEKEDMLKVHQKKGLAGIKIQLHPTDKGFNEYYSQS